MFRIRPIACMVLVIALGGGSLFAGTVQVLPGLPRIVVFEGDTNTTKFHILNTFTLTDSHGFDHGIAITVDNISNASLNLAR